jgi:hypothetical protein
MFGITVLDLVMVSKRGLLFPGRGVIVGKGKEG